MNTEVYLRMFEKKDLAFIHKLRTDEENFSLTLRVRAFASLEDSEAWLEHKMQKNAQYQYLAICLKDTHEIIGFTSVNNIDFISRKAEWGGLVIAREYASKGYGKQTGKLLLDFLFGDLGMHLIYGYVQEENIGSQKLADAAGFKRTGYIPEYAYKNYKYHNVYIYALTRPEYFLHNHIAIEEEVINL